MANNINCTCGHSWSKASSSKKDMYVCHICGKDNTMKDGGWLDNYGKKPNPNDVTVSTGPGYVGSGYDVQGRDYSPAWGGQFQMGGSLPGAVGFTYARTAGSAPSNGKYAKKTKASAQNGKGLGSSKQPTYLTFDTNDPAFQSTEANDFSVFDPNNFQNVKKNLTDYMSSPLYLDRLSKSIPNKNAANKAQQDRLKNVENLKLNPLGEDTNYSKGVVNLGFNDFNDNAAVVHEMSHGVAPTWYGNKNRFLDNIIHSVFQKDQDLRNKELSKLNIPLSSEYVSDVESTYANSNYKPFQDEHYRPKDKSKTQQQVAANETYGDLNAIRQLLFENKVTDKFGQELTPDIWNKALEDRKILNNPLLKRMKLKFSDEDIIKMNNEVAKNNSMIPIDRAQNGKEMKYYQEGLDWKPNSIAQDGGAIVDPMGQWAHPGEVTIIPSTDITMEGVDYPVLGISDTGDQQMMYPGEDYQFDGDYVTEYPMMQDGGWLNKFDQGKAPSDATRVSAPIKPLTKKEQKENVRINKQTQKNTEEYNKAIIADRKSKRETKGDVNVPGSFNISEKLKLSNILPESWTSPGGAVDVFDEYLNPGAVIGPLADSLGESIAARSPEGVATTLAMTLGAGALGFDPLGSSIKSAKKIGKHLTEKTALKRFSKFSGVDDLGMFTQKGSNKYYQLGEPKNLETNNVKINNKLKDWIEENVEEFTIKPEPKPDFGSMTIDKAESENYLKNYQKNLQSNYNRYLKDRKEAIEFWNEEVNILGKDPKDMPPMLRDLINDPNYKNFYLDLEPDTKHIAQGLVSDYSGTDINANLVDKYYLPKGGRALVTKDSGEGLFKKSADNFGDYKQVKPWEVFNKNFFIRKNKNGGWLSKYQDGGGLSRSNLEMMATLQKDIKNQKARNAQETVSQYTPKPGDQQRMNAAKDAYRKEQAKLLNRAASSEVAAKAMENIVEPMLVMEGVASGLSGVRSLMTKPKSISPSYVSPPYEKSGFNPLGLVDDIAPRIDPIKAMGVEMDIMDMSPLNLIPGYGRKLSGKNQTFRKFGNSLDDVIQRQALSPAGGSKFRMGKEQITSEGNWAAKNQPSENYPGVFEATFDMNNPDANLSAVEIANRNGVLMVDRSGRRLPEIPLTEPGMSFNRRLPFSTRYVPIDKQKLMNNEFQFATMAPHLQSLAEKYTLGLGAASVLGKEARDTYNKYTIDPVIDMAKKLELEKLGLNVEKRKDGGWLGKFDTAQSGGTFMDKLDANNPTLQKYLNIEKNRSSGDIASYFSEIGRAQQKPKMDKAIVQADQKRQQQILAEAVANAKGKQATVKQDNRTSREKEIAQKQLLDLKMDKARGTSPFTQTLSSFTPTGSNEAAGQIFAEGVGQMTPMIGATRLFNTVRDPENNPYGIGQGNGFLANTLGTLGLLGDVFDVGAVTAPGVKAAGKYLTEQTPLKNAYKINPFAFEPTEGMMYRGLGVEGMEDAFQSGVFRAKQNVEPSMVGNFDMSKQFDKAYFSPKFDVADQYGQGYIAEVPRTASDWGKRYGKKEWSQIAQRDIPITEGKILQKDWLRGYKEVSQPSGVATPNLGSAIEQSTPLKNISEIEATSPNVKSSWEPQELPGLHLTSTMEGGPISKIVEPKTGLVNVEQALGIIAKESGGASKASLIRNALGKDIPKKMDYNDFRKTVQDQLIPLDREVVSTPRSGYGTDQIGYTKLTPNNRKIMSDRINNTKEEILKLEKEGNIENQDYLDILKANLQIDLKDYNNLPLENQTIRLSNKDKFGRGSDAHDNPAETLGHIHFIRDAESPDVLTMTQMQSDAFQGTHRSMPKSLENAEFSLQSLENIVSQRNNVLESLKKQKEELLINKADKETIGQIDEEIDKFTKLIKDQEATNKLNKAEVENFAQKSLLDKNHQERYLQELVDYAGKRGDVNKVRVPTSETAAKVQGYKGIEAEEIIKRYNEEIAKNPNYTKEITERATENEIKLINDVLNGKKKGMVYEPEAQTILKKYTEQPKVIKKLFGVEPKIVTDSKGNTWYEFDIPSKFKGGKGEIKAFKDGGWLNKYK